jgi:phosphatidyl-myo-inositol dimannoside synthase
VPLASDGPHLPPGRKLLLGAESLAAGNGGICRVARLIARELDEELSAVFSDPDPPPFGLMPVHTARSSRLAYAARFWAAAASRSRTHSIYDSLSMARADPRVWPLRRPHMAFMHGLEVWEGAWPAHIAAARRADVLLTNSNYTRERAGRLHPGLDRAQVCWLATEQDEPVAKQTPAGPPTVTIISRVEHYKGHEALINAWPNVMAAVPDARLVMAGRGPDSAAIASAAARSPVASNIEFLGFVPENQMAELWQRTHVLAMPSRGEGFGLVYIEAMRLGIPVIATIHDAAHEVNIDSETGYNVSLDRANELEDRLIHLLRNSNEADRLGRNGQRRWAEHFTFRAFAARFRPLLKQLLDL